MNSGDFEISEHISDIIAFFALLIAVLSLLVSQRANASQRRLQERFLKIEEDRFRHEESQSLSAHLTAQLRRLGGNNCKLIVKNTGAGKALNIRVFLDNLPLLEHPCVPKGASFVPTLGPDSEAQCAISLGLRTKTFPWKIKITWDDDSEIERIYESSIN